MVKANHHPEARAEQIALARGRLSAPAHYSDAQLREACHILRELSPDHADQRTAGWLLEVLEPEKTHATTGATRPGGDVRPGDDEEAGDV